jgi:hypothetical protein
MPASSKIREESAWGILPRLRQIRRRAYRPVAKNATAPHDRPVVIYAPPREDLPEFAGMCEWHPDAGFCVCELREPTYWMDRPC